MTGGPVAVGGGIPMIKIHTIDTAVVFLVIGYLSAMRQMGKLNWKDFKLWGQDVPREKRRNNLMGLAAILAVIALRVLFEICG